MQKQHIKLDTQDRIELEGLLLKSSLTVKIHKRIQVLLNLDSGKSYAQLRKEVDLTYISMREICDKYLSRQVKQSALDYLSDKPRSGRPLEIDRLQRAKITALACSETPEGYASWSLRLLAEKAIELEYCEHISHNQVGVILKKTRSNLT
jgi:putative transposase